MKNMTKVYGLKSYITIIKIFMKIVLKKKILLENTEAVIQKIKTVPEGVYWLTLGKIKYKTINYYISRIKSALIWRYKNLVEKQKIWPFFIFRSLSSII